MNEILDTARGTLSAMGFAPDRVEAAVVALAGETKTYVPEPQLLPPDELCKQLAISRTTLWRLKAPFIQVGGRKRYDRAEVMAFLATQK